LKEDIAKVYDLAKEFQAAAGGEAAGVLDSAKAGNFLTKFGTSRTAIQRKQELADIDKDNDGKTSFIEFLLLTYKVMILTEFFQRKGTDPDVDLTNDGVGLTGVGTYLIEELFAPPAGLDPELDKMMADFSLEHSKMEEEIEKLQKIVDEGGVKGMGAKTQLDKLKKADTSATNALEAKIAAAIKKAQKKSIEEVKSLRDKLGLDIQEQGGAAEAKQRQKGGGVAAKAALFGS
jgi:hypothetical protein